MNRFWEAGNCSMQGYENRAPLNDINALVSGSVLVGVQ